MFLSSSCRETAKTAMKQIEITKRRKHCFFLSCFWAFSTWIFPQTVVFCRNVFEGFSVRGVQKHQTHIFAEKPHAENFPQTNRQRFRCQFFLDVFVGFIACLDVSRRREFKSSTRNVLLKNRDERRLESKNLTNLLILNSEFSTTTSHPCRPRGQGRQNKTKKIRSTYVRILAWILF
jgi:hypothetical protein